MAKRKKSTFERLQNSSPNRQQRKKLQRQFDADSTELSRARQRGRRRCRQCKSLCVRTTGPGSDAGAGVRKLDGGFTPHGGMAEILRDHHRCDAIDRGVLDCDLRSTGAGRVRCVPGECARDQESAGTQERRTRVPVAEEVTYLWAAAQIVSAAGTDP